MNIRSFLVLILINFACIWSAETAGTKHSSRKPAKKKALIFLHGHPGGPRSPKIRQLQDRLRRNRVAVVAPNLNRGTGGKDGFSVGRAMSRIQRLIKKEKFTDVVIVGHSMGGRIAADLAELGLPELRGLVLYAPAIGLPAKSAHGLKAQKDLAQRKRYPALPKGLQTLIFHANEDNIVRASKSKAFVTRNPQAELRLLANDDHALRHQNDRVVEDTAAFVRDVFRRKTRK